MNSPLASLAINSGMAGLDNVSSGFLATPLESFDFDAYANRNLLARSTTTSRDRVSRAGGRSQALLTAAPAAPVSWLLCWLVLRSFRLHLHGSTYSSVGRTGRGVSLTQPTASRSCPGATNKPLQYHCGGACEWCTWLPRLPHQPSPPSWPPVWLFQVRLPLRRRCHSISVTPAAAPAAVEARQRPR